MCVLHQTQAALCLISLTVCASATWLTPSSPSWNSPTHCFSRTHCPSHSTHHPSLPAAVATSWDHWGYDLTNRRWGYGETALNVSTITKITPKWSFSATSDVTATPVVVGGRVYFPDWGGSLWCLDATTGATIWTKNISQLVYQVDANPYPAATPSSIISRASPAISGSLMVSLCVSKVAGMWGKGCGARKQLCRVRPLSHVQQLMMMTLVH